MFKNPIKVYIRKVRHIRGRRHAYLDGRGEWVEDWHDAANFATVDTASNYLRRNSELALDSVGIVTIQARANGTTHITPVTHQGEAL